MTRSLRRATVLVLCVFLGCTIHPIRLDDAANTRFDDARPSELETKTCGLLLLFPFFAFQFKSHLVRAQRKLRFQAGDDVLTNVRVQESWMWLLLGTLVCTELSATAYPKLP